MRRLLVAVASVATVLTASAAPLTVRDLDGRAWTPLAPGHGEINLLLFVSADCPISSRYAPEMDRIVAAASARGAHAWIVYTDPAIAPARVRTNLKSYHANLHVPVVIDTAFVLTDAVGATVTPEAAIFTDSGRAYRGRIDDLYVTIGQSRRAATRHDLSEALDAVLTGHHVATPETTAIGCFIERTAK